MEKSKIECEIKCLICEHYNKNKDFCKIKCIEDCVRKAKSEFSTCDSYLTKENLIYF